MTVLHLDLDRCTGHGRCYAVAPDLFSDDDDGRPIQLVHELTDDQLAQARESIAACPENAIWLGGADGQETS